MKKEAGTSKWFIPWETDGFHDEEKCVAAPDSWRDPFYKNKSLTGNEIVFAFKLPHRKNNMTLDFSRWQQNLIGVLQVDIAYDTMNPIKSKLIN